VTLARPVIAPRKWGGCRLGVGNRHQPRTLAAAVGGAIRRVHPADGADPSERGGGVVVGIDHHEVITGLVHHDR
jgi:hypothetical protein